VLGGALLGLAVGAALAWTAQKMNKSIKQ